MPSTPLENAEPQPAATPAPTVIGPPPASIEIDLTEQKAYLLKNGRTVASAPISSGRAGHLTPTGDFSVLQKDLNHKSSLYGKIVDSNGRTVIASADTGMSVPRGCHFVSAPMKYFVRFEGAQGTHAGQLPGYPASHGCVRMPPEKAKLFYKSVEVGAPVHVFGRAPVRKPSSRVVTKVSEPPVLPPPPPPMMEPERRSFFDRVFGRNRAPRERASDYER